MKIPSLFPQMHRLNLHRNGIDANVFPTLRMAAAEWTNKDVFVGYPSNWFNPLHNRCSLATVFVMNQRLSPKWCCKIQVCARLLEHDIVLCRSQLVFIERLFFECSICRPNDGREGVTFFRLSMWRTHGYGNSRTGDLKRRWHAFGNFPSPWSIWSD